MSDQARLHRDHLIVESKGDNGNRTTTYALSSDKEKLKVSVRMTGKRLDQPIVYNSTYARR